MSKLQKNKSVNLVNEIPSSSSNPLYIRLGLGTVLKQVTNTNNSNFSDESVKAILEESLKEFQSFFENHYS